jgi:hypothetical protein
VDGRGWRIRSAAGQQRSKGPGVEHEFRLAARALLTFGKSLRTYDEGDEWAISAHKVRRDGFCIS